MIDTLHSIQLWTCNSCNFNWKEIWSSYSQSIWSLQYRSDCEQAQQQLQIAVYERMIQSQDDAVMLC